VQKLGYRELSASGFAGPEVTDVQGRSLLASAGCTPEISDALITVAMRRLKSPTGASRTAKVRRRDEVHIEQALSAVSRMMLV
jgi:hypothetical protein